MALIKLVKRNEAGQDVAPFFLNTDQIVAVGLGAHTTEILTTDHTTFWVRETPEQVVGLVNAPPR